MLKSIIKNNISHWALGARSMWKEKIAELAHVLKVIIWHQAVLENKEGDKQNLL